MRISIIIVHYKAKKELFECITSIYESKPRVSYEILIIDNDELEVIGKEIRKKFPKVTYIKNKGNFGLSNGNNLGAKYAKGELFFFLNPDTKVFRNTIDNLVYFFDKHKKAGLVAPLLIDINNNPYKLQGTLELKPLNGVIVSSFINKLIPNNSISKKFWLLNWDKKDTKEVDTVHGTAFCMRNKIFEKVNGFDEKLFLYFEENDLSKRVKDLGYKNYIITDSKVFHIWGASSKSLKNLESYFSNSRFLYFKKHFGLFAAILISLISNLNRTNVFLGIVIAIGCFLRFYKLSESMIFIGDQGWFYLSARDLILTHEIPLVGITASHTWLHQGPLWTYMLAGILWLFNFHPIAPAVFTVAVDIFTIFAIYITSKQIFSKKVGFIASLLYSTSPLIIIYSRMPYHTSLIPLFSILSMYSFYKLVAGNFKFFPLLIFSLTILYNFELATSVLWFIFFPALFYLYYKNRNNLKQFLNKKILALSFISFVVPMLPIFIYDVKNGFPQTVKFVVWMVYRILSFFIHSSKNSFSVSTLGDMSFFFVNRYNLLIFSISEIIAVLIFTLSSIYLLRKLYKEFRINEIELSYLVIALFVFLPIIGFFINQTPSDAYLPILFPPIILMTSLFLSRLLEIKYLNFLISIVLMIIATGNIYFLLSNNYSMGQGNFSFDDRLNVSKKIVEESDKKKYNLINKGPGQEFSSSMMNYQYLTWWLGNEPSKQKQKLQFMIVEKDYIHVTKNE